MNSIAERAKNNAEMLAGLSCIFFAGAAIMSGHKRKLRTYTSEQELINAQACAMLPSQKIYPTANDYPIEETPTSLRERMARGYLLDAERHDYPIGI